MSASEQYAPNKAVTDGLTQALLDKQTRYVTQIRRLYFDCYCAPLFDDKGAVAGAVGLGLDKSERKLSEMSHRDTKRLGAIVDAQQQVMTGSLDRESVMRASLAAIAKLCDAESATVDACDNPELPDELVVVLGGWLSAKRSWLPI